MKRLKFIFICLACMVLSGCGVDKFFIERGIDKVDQDVEKELNEFARLSTEQKEQAKKVGEATEQWVRKKILPRTIGLLELIASDIESVGYVQKSTYDAVVEFFYRPAELSKNDALITDLAELLHGMTPEQDLQAKDRLIDNHKERTEKRKERDLQAQREGIIKGLRTLFRGLGVPRTRDELKAAAQILEARVDLMQETNEFYEQTHKRFVLLAEKKPVNFEQFLSSYREAWQSLEAGPSSAHPEKFKFNADNGYEAIDFLIRTLTAEERTEVITAIKDYQEFLTTLTHTP